jgi:flavin reductase (DIM6/NTAB) family NADH-FMN oxidoreductase RutF
MTSHEIGISAAHTNGSVTSASGDERGAGVDKATFFAIMGAFPTGVTIVTTLDSDGHPKGLTSNAVCSVSAEPPLVLVCVDKRSNTLPALQQTRKFVVNYLVAGRGELSNLFASKEPDKFVDVAWRPASNGMPLLHADTLAHAECTTIQEIEAGDHIIIIGHVAGGQPAAPGTLPLLYFRRGYSTWTA